MGTMKTRNICYVGPQSSLINGSFHDYKFVAHVKAEQEVLDMKVPDLNGLQCVARKSV